MPPRSSSERRPGAFDWGTTRPASGDQLPDDYHPPVPGVDDLKQVLVPVGQVPIHVCERLAESRESEVPLGFCGSPVSRQFMSGLYSPLRLSTSGGFAVAASKARRTISTFSCDIACEVSPLGDASPTRSGREGIRPPANDAGCKAGSVTARRPADAPVGTGRSTTRRRGSPPRYSDSPAARGRLARIEEEPRTAERVRASSNRRMRPGSKSISMPMIAHVTQLSTEHRDTVIIEGPELPASVLGFEEPRSGLRQSRSRSIPR